MLELLNILLAADKGPPSEFRIFTAGQVDTKKGLFRFDEESVRQVMAKVADYGNDYPIDYDHAMVSYRPENPAHAGKAAGWFTPEVRDGELWATKVSWTPAASKAITDREWRYISPAFRLDDERRIVELLNIALTNLPATKRLDPLVAHDKPSPAAPSPAQEPPMKTLLVALGLAIDASEDQALARLASLSQFRASILASTGKDDPNAALGVIEAWKQGAASHTALSQRVAEMEKASAEARLSALVDKAVVDGKATPATKDHLLAMGRASIDTLSAFLEASPVIASVTNTHTEPAGGSEPVTPEMLAVAKLLSLDPKEMAKHA